MENYTGIIHVDSHAIDNRTKNKISSFTNFLPGQFTYTDGAYEVALTEIQFPQTWYNLTEDQYVVALPKNENGDGRMFVIRAGFWSSIDEIIGVLNQYIYEYLVDDKLKPTSETPDAMRHILYVDHTMRVKLLEHFEQTMNSEIFFSRELALILGFTSNFISALRTGRDHADLMPEEIYRATAINDDIQLVREVPCKLLNIKTDHLMVALLFQSKSHVFHKRLADQPYNIMGNTELLFVYTNLIKEHVFGNQSKRILRVFPVFYGDLQNFGQVITRTFQHPQFYPLFETSFDRIEIELRDRLGNLIPFNGGSVIATLEIRKKDGVSLF